MKFKYLVAVLLVAFAFLMSAAACGENNFDYIYGVYRGTMLESESEIVIDKNKFSITGTNGSHLETKYSFTDSKLICESNGKKSEFYFSDNYDVIYSKSKDFSYGPFADLPSDGYFLRTLTLNDSIKFIFGTTGVVFFTIDNYQFRGNYTLNGGVLIIDDVIDLDSAYLLHYSYRVVMYFADNMVYRVALVKNLEKYSGDGKPEDEPQQTPDISDSPQDEWQTPENPDNPQDEQGEKQKFGGDISHLGMPVGEKCSDCGLEVYIKTEDAVLMYERERDYARAEFYGETVTGDFKPFGSRIKELFIAEGAKYIESGAFSSTAIESVVFPEGLTEIGEGAFEYCSNLIDINIPEGLTKIGRRAFEHCSKLNDIEIPDTVTTIGYDAFFGTAWLSRQADGLVYAGKVAYDYKGEMPFDAVIELREDTLGIAELCFYNSGYLRSIKGGRNIVYIGYNAFGNCISLTNAPVSEKLQYIGDSAFYGCISLTDIIIPDSIKSIDGYAFNGCNNIEKIFYGGSEESWRTKEINFYSGSIQSATLYYYSSNNPVYGGDESADKFWYFGEDGEINIWN